MSENTFGSVVGQPGAEGKVCGCCNKPVLLTPRIGVVYLFVPGLNRPYPLIPDEGYATCARASCDGAWRFVDHAQGSHAVTRGAGKWTRAILMLENGQGIDPRNDCRPTFGAPEVGVA